MNARTLLLVPAVCCLAPAAMGQSGNAGVSLGVYMPTSGGIREAFGNTILRFGFDSVGRQKTGNLKIGTGMNIITANRNGNRLFMLPVTLEVEQQLSFDPNASARPYAKAFVGAAYIDYGIFQNGSRYEGKLIRATLGAELGVVMGERLRLSARYNAFPNSGFDFSGVSLNLTYAFMP